MTPLLWITLILFIVVVALLAFGARRVNIPRQAGFEGIDDPAAAIAYDRISRLPQFRLLRCMVLNELKKHHPAGTIVDVGCGPGYLVALIAREFPRLQVIGVDISPEMAGAVAKNMSALGLDDLAIAQVFRLGDSQSLPFADGEVDFIVSSLSLHHWSQPELALGEIQRALKPGGQFLIFDLRRDAPRLFYGLLNFAMTIVVPIALRRYNEPVGSALASYTPVEAEALCSGISFSELEVKPGFAWLFIWGRTGFEGDMVR